MNFAESKHQAEKFITFLSNIQDSGTRSTLRGGLGTHDTKISRTWPILCHFGGIPTEKNHHLADVVRTIAGLYMLPGVIHSENAKSIGQSLLLLVSADERKNIHKVEETGPMARRFQYLLAASRGEICQRLVPYCRRLSNENGAINFVRLYLDLIYWSQATKANWAADFWGTSLQPIQDTELL